MKKSLFPLCLAVGLLFGGARVVTAEVVTLRYESAPSLDGPWTEVAPTRMQVMPDGAASIDEEGANIFYRLKIAGRGSTGALPLISTNDLPRSLIDRVRRHLVDTAGRTEDPERGGDDSESWVNADIAPFVCPIYTPGNQRGAPRLAELKLIRRQQAPGTRNTFLRDYSADETAGDAGYMIVSLDRSDLPVLEFATEGSTPGERLMKRTRGSVPARIVRYGPTFWAAEDQAGNLVANLGTEPFKIPHSFLAQMTNRWEGEFDSDTETYEMPPVLDMNLEEYATYDDFKEDMENSPVQQLMRQRRAQHARWEWDLEDGIIPPIFRVVLGETDTFLPGTAAEQLVVHWEENDDPLAAVSSDRTSGGIQVTGLQLGSAPLSYYVGDEYMRAIVHVVQDGRTTPSLQDVVFKTSVFTYIAGNGWSDQMKYYQLKDDDWCDLVGCGPTAIAMLLGWWDNRGVPSAFYSFGFGSTFFSSLKNNDAPKDISSASEKQVVRRVYDELHELCDVICPWGSDAGATWPGDLIEGFYGYMWTVSKPAGAGTLLYGKGSPLVGVYGSWAWDSWGDDWETAGKRVAIGIKKNRPGVIGLGVLWHYGVAYAYRREKTEIVINGDTVFAGSKRYFKVNEGWSSFSPSWYSAYDVFLGLTANITQKKTPTP